jgi:hypothetical protein
MLPPFTVAGCAAALAAASLFAGDTTALRVITAATALTACVGAALARSWDRSAGHRVAELETLRERDEWHTDDRVAELETDLEESRELRGRLEKKLRGKRAELARLRTEHADLLRRYATAESERARALEARRRLQLEGAAAQQPLALPAGPSPVGPAAFLKAAQALRELPRNAARQQAQRTVVEARRRDVATHEEPQGRHAAAEDGVPATSPAGLPVREARLVPAVAAAVLPYAQPQRSAAAPGTPAHRAIGGFDFFGTQHGKAPALPRAVGGAVPGEAVPGGAVSGEAVSGGAVSGGAVPRGAGSGGAAEHTRADEAVSEVIDLTAHDETEQLDMSELRAKA